VQFEFLIYRVPQKALDTGGNMCFEFRRSIWLVDYLKCSEISSFCMDTVHVSPEHLRMMPDGCNDFLYIKAWCKILYVKCLLRHAVYWTWCSAVTLDHYSCRWVSQLHCSHSHCWRGSALACDRPYDNHIRLITPNETTGPFLVLLGKELMLW
jgi:hypothetical protein